MFDCLTFKHLGRTCWGATTRSLITAPLGCGQHCWLGGGSLFLLDIGGAMIMVMMVISMMMVMMMILVIICSFLQPGGDPWHGLVGKLGIGKPRILKHLKTHDKDWKLMKIQMLLYFFREIYFHSLPGQKKLNYEREGPALQVVY